MQSLTKVAAFAVSVLVGGVVTTGCSSSSSSTEASEPSSSVSPVCSEILGALAPFDAASKDLEPYTVGDKVEEEIPQSIIDQYATAQEQAATTLAAIADREDGDTALMAEKLSTYLAATDKGDPTVEETGLTGYMMLGQICDWTRD